MTVRVRVREGISRDDVQPDALEPDPNLHALSW